MTNIKIFCMCLHDHHFENLKKLNYTPVGLGTNKFSDEWLNDKSGELALTLNSSDLNDYSSSGISKALINKARAIGTVPSLQGSVLSALPAEGSSMSLRVGGSTYDLIFRNGKLSVDGPEEQRILTSLEAVSGGYQVSVAVPDGTMSGRTIEVLNNTDASPFGLATSDSASKAILRGRALSFEDTTGVAVAAGLTSGKRYIINSMGTTDFTTADTGNTLANATVGDIFASDGGALTGTGKVKQVFVSDGGTKLSGGNSDFVSLLDVHTLSDLQTADVSSSWIIADNSGNTSLAVGASYALTHNGTAFQLNGVTLQAGIKLIAAGKEFEVVENASSNHNVGTVFTLNVNSAGNLTDENGVAIANTLGVVEHENNAKLLGLQAGTFDFEATQDGFRVISTTADVVDIDLDAKELPGQILSMKKLPPEDLIIFLEKEGARRLGAQYELMDIDEQQNEERNYRLEMTDQNLGKVEVIETESGHSIATRFTSGVSEIDLGAFRLNLSGFADQGDYFEIGLNQSKAGDSRNAEAIVALNSNTPDRNSFQEDFRSIALSVGSQLVSGRMIEVSAISMRDAARITEDELSGVNLDEEASRLMEQQQAYKAAAQILQTARQMFDTLVNIM